MSNRKELPKILSREIEKVNIATLADRPTSGSRYGVGDLTAQSLKERFDAFPNLVKDRLNAIIDALASSDAGKYITIPPEVIKDVDNIFDFIALFCEKASDEKNISDYIEALYTKVTETEPTSRTLQEIVDDMASRIVNVGDAQSGYDIVIRSDDEFSKCIYPLYKDEENLTRAEAALMVTDDNAFNTPDPEFAAKRVLVKGVTFKKMRGYDDVRLHIFQPSIEHIKFDNCRWETHWKVSGKNPRDTSAANYNLNTAPERATAFNRATDPLTLTIEGLHVSEDNVSVARVSDQWGVGLRNVKAIKNCYIDYPKNYKLAPEGYSALEMSCQFFDFADNCKISGLWDGTNVVNCKVSKILKRCTNVANVEAMNLLDSNGALKPISAENCNNMVNLKGLINFSSCVGVAASREEAQGYAATAEKNATDVANTKVPIGTPSSFSDGAMVYAQLPNGALGFVHARTGYNVNEIVMRDNKRLTYARPSDYNQKIADYYDNPAAACGVWSKSAMIPRDYVDKLVKGDSYGNNGYAPLNGRKKIDDKYLPVYAPLVDGKVPAANLPSYVDDVLEYVSEFVFPFEGESGKIYIDTTTNKAYRWSGSQYVEISHSLALGTTSSTAFAGDKGQTAYDHSQSTGNPHDTTAEDIGAYTKDEVDDKIEANKKYVDDAVAKSVSGGFYLSENYYVDVHVRATSFEISCSFLAKDQFYIEGDAKNSPLLIETLEDLAEVFWYSKSGVDIPCVGWFDKVSSLKRFKVYAMTSENRNIILYGFTEDLTFETYKILNDGWGSSLEFDVKVVPIPRVILSND